ncbi:right-handed parallel beta-helix repeat-containing protein [Methylobacterium sp. WL8]|uniref:right-handed parallel beta-helix repeat-containing protein n=1 Tax=Methylobacterium sp. WL8 TaxID=2603899 RepID=UPI0011C7DDA1|nr:right-handed parallel beta-helix repeat-containing protein [Methylobacterium sp. WL8]TXN84016.1 right-handed parallel beta-helix repeat-containing protein [Methylobacterium sp. WL8]
MIVTLPPAPPALVEPVSARACDAATRARLLSPPRPGDDTAAIACSITLSPGDHVLRRVVVEGAEASGAEIDCAGATIGRAEPAPTLADFAIEIRSRAPAGPGGTWSRPSGVMLRNCRILGHVRVWGMGLNGQGAAVKASSHSLGHTERAQAAAPTEVTIRDSTITALGHIPLYLAPGVTRFTLQGSTLDGRSGADAIYLDAESADNVIADNTIAVALGREAIAVDGSARNRITGNRIATQGQGGVRLYRNCGEGGTVRHQTPSDNVVTGNTFTGDGLFASAAIVVNSRGGWRLYCSQDSGYPFGSSLDNADGGTGNVVAPNTVE